MCYINRKTYVVLLFYSFLPASSPRFLSSVADSRELLPPVAKDLFKAKVDPRSGTMVLN